MECLVAAPSKLQRPAGDRVKTDVRDAASAAAAAGLSARGAAAIAMLTELTTGHALFADTVGVSGVSYTAQDAISQVALSVEQAL